MRHEFRHYSHRDVTNVPVGDEMITFETDAVTLEELLETFGRYLRACGFSFDGQVGIVSDD